MKRCLFALVAAAVTLYGANVLAQPFGGPMAGGFGAGQTATQTTGQTSGQTYAFGPAMMGFTPASPQANGLAGNTAAGLATASGTPAGSQAMWDWMTTRMPWFF